MVNKKYLAFVLICKIGLDVFSPLRNVNFGIEFVLFLSLLLRKENFALALKSYLPFVFILFVAYSALSDFNEVSIKYLLSVFFFYSMYTTATYAPLNTLVYATKMTSVITIFCCFVNIVLSVVTGVYSTRNITNFEHVNLFGSLLVFTTIFYLTYNYLKGFRNHSKTYNKTLIGRFLFTALGFLSTSTGAFLVILSSFLPSKYLKAKFILRVAVLGAVGMVSLYFVTEFVTPDLHQKIFGTIDVFRTTISFGYFYRLSVQNDNIGLTQAMNVGGSFTWRLYNYILYLNRFFSADILTIIFGSGANSYHIYNPKYLPHNDFIWILVDFGVLGLLSFIVTLIRLLRLAAKKSYTPLIYLVIFTILRLGFENVISSSYLNTLILCLYGLLLGINRNINTYNLSYSTQKSTNKEDVDTTRHKS